MAVLRSNLRGLPNEEIIATIGQEMAAREAAGSALSEATHCGLPDASTAHDTRAVSESSPFFTTAGAAASNETAVNTTSVSASAVASTTVISASALPGHSAVQPSQQPLTPDAVATQNEAAEQRTLTRSHETRSRNTMTSYHLYQKEFKEWCDSRYSMVNDVSQRHLVTTSKLHMFMTHFQTREKKIGKANKDGQKATVSAGAMKMAKAAIVALWTYQREREDSKEPHPAESQGLVAELLKQRSLEEAARKRASLEDQSGGLGIELTSEDYKVCNAHLLKATSEGGKTSIRDRFIFNLRHSTVLRGDDTRAADLCDLGLSEYTTEGMQPYNVVTLMSDYSKTKKGDKLGIIGALRHKDWSMCVVNSLAAYLFSRFHISGEATPNLGRPEEWYNTKLLLSRKTSNNGEMSYGAHHEVVKSVLAACGYTGRSFAHIGRKAGIQYAEISGVQEQAMRRAGGWQVGALEQAFSKHLPISFIRAQAGFSPDGDGKSYHLSRAVREPPMELQKQIFPWLDDFGIGDAEKVELPCSQAKLFHKLLLYLRVVLLQDMVLVFKDYPDHPFKHHAPFNNDAFSTWAATLIANMSAEVNPQAELVHKLAPAVAEALRLQTQSINALRADIGTLRAELEEVGAALNDLKATQVAGMARITAGIASITTPRSAACSDQELINNFVPMFNSMINSIRMTIQLQHPGLELPNLQLSSASPPQPTAALGQVDGTMQLDLDHATETETAPMTARSRKRQRDEEEALRLPKMSRSVTRVTDAWQEWFHGLDGGLSIRDLESMHGAKWRPEKGGHKKFFFTRRLLIDAVKEFAQKQGIPELEAVRRAEVMQGRSALPRLREMLVQNATGQAQFVTQMSALSQGASNSSNTTGQPTTIHDGNSAQEGASASA